MTCEHLIELENAISAAGFEETFRGAPWSQNWYEWVYFDCVLPIDAVRKAFPFAECVGDHAHRGTHDGQESGFVCEVHKDGIMGHHPSARPEAKTFQP
ncbi:MAG TPA: hypothetical protein VK629_09145 [Steroidobacteraceae bacterium]|nr:hypothetical protein [Steroidobacteraceae bacterium]